MYVRVHVCTEHIVYYCTCEFGAVLKAKVQNKILRSVYCFFNFYDKRQRYDKK